MTLGEAGSLRRRNNFDILRLLAAVSVLVSHSWVLSGAREPGVPLTHDTLGYVGVLVFFSISGYLITQSWILDPRPVAFVWKRALRIAPALVVMLVLVAYVIGPIVSTLPADTYLTSPSTFKYVVANAMMSTDYSLPGVFSSNASPTVNGSLGTLPVEVKAYAMVLVLGLAASARRWAPRVLLVAAFAVVLFASFSTGVKSTSTLVVLFATFAGAATYFQLRDKVRLDGRLFVLALALWVLSYQAPLPIHALLTGAAFPYLVLFLAYRGLGLLRPLTRPGDVSYGIFIWAFPVQQTLLHLWPGVSPWVLLAVALPVTYLIALLSWRLVEQPALRQKAKLARLGAPGAPRGVQSHISRPTDVLRGRVGRFVRGRG